MSGPLIVIIAAIYTAWLAISTSDGLVDEDYYKKGLAAQQSIARSAQAEKWGLTADMRMVNGNVTVILRTEHSEFKAPQGVQLTLSHPTRAGLDQVKMLARDNDRYTAALRLPNAGHWLILLEDDQKTWRLLGNVILPGNGEIRIGTPNSSPAPTPADIRNQ